MVHEIQIPDTYLNEKEAAQELGMSVDWLRKRRRLRQGPPFVRFGRAVRYSRSGLDVWAAAQREEVTK